MNKYEVIYAVDEQDCSFFDPWPLEEFLDDLDLRIEALNKTRKDVFVSVIKREYDDEDTGENLILGEIQFLVKA